MDEGQEMNKSGMKRWKQGGFVDDKAKIHTIIIKNMKVSVHKHVNHPDDVWLLSCNDLGILRKVLENRDLRCAKGEALGYVLDKLSEIQSEVKGEMQTLLDGGDA